MALWRGPATAGRDPRRPGWRLPWLGVLRVAALVLVPLAVVVAIMPLGSTWSYLDLTALGRQEEWEDSPGGYPQTPAYAWWNWHDEYDHPEMAQGPMKWGAPVGAPVARHGG